jgi:hypothetical protein
LLTPTSSHHIKHTVDSVSFLNGCSNGSSKWTTFPSTTTTTTTTMGTPFRWLSAAPPQLDSPTNWSTNTNANNDSSDLHMHYPAATGSGTTAAQWAARNTTNKNDKNNNNNDEDDLHYTVENDVNDSDAIPQAPTLVRNRNRRRELQGIPKLSRPLSPVQQVGQRALNMAQDIARVVTKTTPINNKKKMTPPSSPSNKHQQQQQQLSEEKQQKLKKVDAQWRAQQKRQMDPTKRGAVATPKTKKAIAENKAIKTAPTSGGVEGVERVAGPIIQHLSETIRNAPDIPQNIKDVFNDRSDQVWSGAGQRILTEEELWARQIKDEAWSQENAMLRMVQELSTLKQSSKAGALGPGKMMLKTWYEDFMSAINHEFKLIKEQHDDLKTKRPPRVLSDYHRVCTQPPTHPSIMPCLPSHFHSARSHPTE